MKTTVAVAAAAALTALTTLATVQGAAAAPAGPAGPVGPTITCGAPGAPGPLLTRACVEISGNQVRFYGVATANDPSWTPQSVGFTISGTVIGGVPLAPANPTVLIQSGSNSVGSVFTSVACGLTVSNTFSVNQPGLPASTATVSTVVAC
ncbi:MULTISPECIES: hypothetical protein [Kitasatospora]|uniref:Secreted protein n=1 Tax=Kitasatospora setae (strain ATCC 33774 / DSM 43861 / JCM 3304 / KCC A-0304 / NBRC 14216 / KM-6054) TaxID=452652 RepID=E4NJZ4_KITSK|nr:MULTISPECIES: hypothetical protein [Kitasatospora]BAJ33292.1 hypothetical protein KSE_75400 [Kitasatospora setae KM-6054]